MTNNVLDWDKPETWTAMIDRSPCGTGTCAIMALLHSKGQLDLQQDFIHESILGTTFRGRLIGETIVGKEQKALIPEISG
jgi:proline racemase